jgi:hypothetical protein
MTERQLDWLTQPRRPSKEDRDRVQRKLEETLRGLRAATHGLDPAEERKRAAMSLEARRDEV